MLTDKQLRDFGNAIRLKSDWETKILDKERNLGLRWANEAQLLSQGNHMPEDESRVLEYLSELEEEARRIIFHDRTTYLGLSPKSPRQTYDFELFRLDVSKAQNFLKASRYGILPAELREDVGVFVCDNMVPASVHSALVQELDRLAESEPKDWHPGSGGKVQDLIHPSLYPYKINFTPLATGASHSKLVNTFFHSTMHPSCGPDTKYKSPYAWIPSVFRVSPDGVSVEIRSYINGLGPRERYPELYTLIENVFTVAMPLLERTVNFEFEPNTTPSQRRWEKRVQLRRGDIYDPRILRSEWEALVEAQNKERLEEKQSKASAQAEILKQAMDEYARFDEIASTKIQPGTGSFAGRDLKVIVKAANYVLNPGESYKGNWHIEGMPHERIVASAIYYYYTDEAVVDDGLELRRMHAGDLDFPSTEEYRHEHFRYKLVDSMDDDNDDDDDDEDEEEVEDKDEDEAMEDYPSDWDTEYKTWHLPEVLSLGTVPTKTMSAASDSSPQTGRILTFPNWIQHKVAGVKNSDTAGSVAQRKILCFFLVDDSDNSDFMGYRVRYPGLSYAMPPYTVLTTADVPYQARGCNFPTLHLLLPSVCKLLTGKILPAELVELIINLGDDHRYPDRGGALGISRKVAEEMRREVMDDRRPKANNERFLFRSFSLCEH